LHGLPFPKVVSYLLIRKWKTVTPGLSPSYPNAPRVTLWLAQ